MNRIYLLDFKIVIGKPRQMEGLGVVQDPGRGGSSSAPINVGSSRVSWAYGEVTLLAGGPFQR